MAAYVLVAYTTLALPSCDIKDEELWERVDELFERVEKLEDVCSQMNADIHSVQSVIDAIQNNYSITSVTPLDNEEGYAITFSNGEKITINHGKNGTDGKDGENGKDGQTPTINIKDMGNGQYAWLLNGEILRDEQGNPIPVNGQDGKDGEDGEDGKDGYNGTSAPTPIVKTGSELISSGVDGSWDREAIYISVNRGYSWTQISSGNGNSIFLSVNTENVGYIEFALTNGIKFTVPRTDDLASLIIGEWKCDLYYTFQFMSNGTFIKTDIYNNNKEIGTYEVLPNQYYIILYLNETAEDCIHIINIDKYMMRWEEYDNRLTYLYKSDAFIFDKTEINAPQEGGTFTIQVDAKFPFYISEDNSNHLDNSNTNNIYATNNSTLSYTVSETENSIVVTIDSNMSNLNLIAEFYIEDTYGNRIATITINQEKNTEVVPSEVSLSEWGKSQVQSAYYSALNAYSELENMHRLYIGGDDSNFKPGLSANNGTLSYNWEIIYFSINEINKVIRQAEQEFSNGPLKAPLETLRAILYYNLAISWGNVNYVTEENLNDFNSIQQLTTKQLFEKLVPQLKNAIDVLAERQIPDNYNFEDFIYLSKDVARIVLAQIYMYEGEYKEAESLLQEVKDNGYYNKAKDIIFWEGQNSIYRYTIDILLGLVECKLNSENPDDANSYITEILNSNTSLNIESIEKKQIMKEIYLEYYNPYFVNDDGYFAFLKRNGLAKETIGITEDYQLLFPIPQSELDLNPNMVQNPGY